MYLATSYDQVIVISTFSGNMIFVRHNAYLFGSFDLCFVEIQHLSIVNTFLSLTFGRIQHISVACGQYVPLQAAILVTRLAKIILDRFIIQALVEFKCVGIFIVF